MRTKTTVLIVVLLLVAIGVFFAIWHKATPPGVVKIGVLRHESSLPFYVAQDKGYFAQHGVTVELVDLPPADHMPALISGRVDMISATSFPVLFGIMVEHPDLLYAVFPGAEVEGGQTVYGIVVARSSQAKELNDLAGRKVMAINPYTRVNIKMILDAAGMRDEDRPKISEASREAALAAVASGTADAAIMDQPALATALASGDFRLLIANPRAKYVGSPYWSGAGAVTRKTWSTQEAQVRNVLAAYDDAVRFIRQDSAGAHRILAARLGLDASVANQMGGYYFPLSDEPVSRKGIQQTVDALVKAGLLKSGLDTNTMFPPKVYPAQ